VDFVPILSIFLRPAIRAVAAAAVAGAPILSGASAQAPADSRRYTALWIVQGKAVPAGVRTIRKGGFVSLQRLLPPILVRLEADAADAETGKALAPAGAELFGLVTSGPPLFCVTGRQYTQRCFADMDRDGRLDGHFTKSNPVQVLPSFSGKRPEKMKPVKGGRYTPADPGSIKTKYIVGIRFARVNSLLQTPNPVFRIVYGTEDWTDHLTREIMPGAGAQSVEALGARFRILGLNGDSVEVAIDSNIPPQPFGVEQQTSFGYY